MNVLEVYPTFAWWICGADLDEIARTRARLETDAEGAEQDRKAFYLVGDAAAFEMIAATFDEIVVHYEPGALKRLVLERHTREWLRGGGSLRFEPAEAEPLSARSESSLAGWVTPFVPPAVH